MMLVMMIKRCVACTHTYFPAKISVKIKFKKKRKFDKLFVLFNSKFFFLDLLYLKINSHVRLFFFVSGRGWPFTSGIEFSMNKRINSGNGNSEEQKKKNLYSMGGAKSQSVSQCYRLIMYNHIH